MKEIEDNRYIKSFHLAGTPTPRFFIDANIYGRSIAAMINTNLSISKIDIAVLFHCQQKRPGRYQQKNGIIKVPMVINNKNQLVECEIAILAGDIRIELGINFLMKQYILIKLNGHNIARKHGNPLDSLRSRFELDITINEKPLSAIIDTGLLQSLIHPIVFDNQHKNLTVLPLSVTWNTITTVVHFTTYDIMHSTPVRLGMDFLMKSNFYFLLGRIGIETQGTWVSQHQDMFEYVYNHPNGHRLRDLLAVYKKKGNLMNHVL